MDKLQVKLTEQEAAHLVRVLEHAGNPDLPCPAPGETARLAAWIRFRYTRYFGPMALVGLPGGDQEPA